MTKPSAPPPGWLINSMVVVIMSVWAANFAARAFIDGYDPPEGIDVIMVAAAGYLFGKQKIGEKEPSNDDKKDRGNE